MEVKVSAFLQPQVMVAESVLSFECPFLFIIIAELREEVQCPNLVVVVSSRQAGDGSQTALRLHSVNSLSAFENGERLDS